MKRTKDNITLIILLIGFFLLFKYSTLVKSSIISSLELWAISLVPSMLPMYLILDLLINYRIQDLLYKIFKSHMPFLLAISLLSGTPSNAKYIKEFYEKEYISLDTANLLLACAYSPNPLFIIAMCQKDALVVLGYLYVTDLIIYLIFKHSLNRESSKEICFQKYSFIDCLSNSIQKSFNILILILGIVVFFGIINTLLGACNIDSVFIKSILELTNALFLIKSQNLGLTYTIFACSFAGLSIHTQIKSITIDTPISYKYFLYGRLIALIPIVIFMIF